MTQVVDLDIEKPAAGGRMLARHDGQVVLVWGAIPGERIRARIERIGKGVAYAETVEVLQPSADRRPAPADWRCGGNALAHVAYARQLSLKGEIIADAFRRIGRLPIDAVTVIASPETGYRMRARLHASNGRLGFFREGSHELCDPATTSQLLPATSDWIASAEARLQRGGLMGVTSIEFAENIPATERCCHLELAPGERVAPYAVLAEDTRLSGLSVQRADHPGTQQLAGVPTVTDVLRLNGQDDKPTLTLARDARAFFQTNRYLLEALVHHVLARVPDGPVVDLYAGVGLFGLGVAARGGGAVTLVEGDPVSGADLERNATPFRSRVAVARQSVEAFLAHQSRRARRSSIANGESVAGSTFIIDPPRTGMRTDALQGLLAHAPRRVVYVSCDVATLARDAQRLVGAGYTLDELSGFDLFPNTAHVESVAVFGRDGSAR